MLSVIIPAKNEIYLSNTIESILSACRGDIEVFAVCDGYWPDPPVMDDKRVNIIHYSQSVGQRAAINNAAKIAKGKYLFKIDAHCMVDEGFDIKLAENCEYDWTVIPTQYVLDAETWQPKWHKRADFLYFNSPWAQEEPMQMKYYDAKCARAYPEHYRAYKAAEWRKGQICDTMCSLGAAWFIHKERFWELGGLDENHAHWGQMAVEMACKAWLSGGRQVVNKNTWFAHQWRRNPPWRLTQKDVSKSRKYSIKFWQEGKWPLQKYPLQWLADKFAPVPTWHKVESKIDIQTKEYHTTLIRYMRGRKGLNKFPVWMGYPVIKYPQDMIVYQQIIFENRPEIVIETGTYMGGAALFYANIFDLIGNGQVISIDNKDYDRPEHPRITYIKGRSTENTTIETVRQLVKDKTVMASLDSNHHRSHVKRELIRYGDIVTPGQYMVVEDAATHYRYPGPGEAVEWFVKRTKNFERVPLEKQFLLSLNGGGWLLKKK